MKCFSLLLRSSTGVMILDLKKVYVGTSYVVSSTFLESQGTRQKRGLTGIRQYFLSELGVRSVGDCDHTSIVSGKGM